MGTISYLEYSNRDIRYAKEMFRAKCFDPCGRFCQQAVEKRFKHYIETYGNYSDKFILSSHNLGKLYARVCELAKISMDKIFRGDLATLTDYYFDTNYPQEHGNIELTEEMAIDAIHTMETLCGWLDKLMRKD